MTYTTAEYHAVREEAGLLDRSGVGKLAIIGPDRYSWLQGMVSNDVRLLEQGAASLLACILDATGHLLTDLTLIAVPGDSPIAAASGVPDTNFVLAELPRANVEKIRTLLDRFIILEEVELQDVSDRLGCLSLQGPRSAEFLRGWQAENEALGQLIAENFFLVEADHTGSGGFDLYCAAEVSETIRQALMRQGVPEVGAAAQEILRVEAGIPLYGRDMDESVIALEANLGPTHISLTKGCYVGQEIIARIDSRGHTNRALTGFVLSGTPLPTPGEKLTSVPTGGEPAPREVGRLTSVVACSPAMDGRPIALGYARHEARAPGTRLRIGEGESERTAEVVALPFTRGTAA